VSSVIAWLRKGLGGVYLYVIVGSFGFDSIFLDIYSFSYALPLESLKNICIF
jgi:hypothetical protein